MNITEVQHAIKRVIARHTEAFRFIGNSQTKLLELGAITGIAEHYRSKGYKTRVVNPDGKDAFVVKTSTRGFPWNFSRIAVDGTNAFCELHMNVLVRGAHDVGVYCVDVACVRPGSLPSAKGKKKWVALENENLLTFAEVKKLVVYPMLLAQFIGIVHEIKPAFLSGRKSVHKHHHSPALIALGHYSANAGDIVKSYVKRGISVVVAPDFDGRLARVRIGASTNPLTDAAV